MRDFAVDIRYPDEKELIDYAPSADLAYQDAALVALNDALGSVLLNDLTPAVRAAWVNAARRIPEELTTARNLELEGAALRPGWPYHAYLAGKLTYAIERQSTVHEPPARWITPMRFAAARASGDDAIWGTLAGASLESWSQLSPQQRAEVLPELHRAFLDADFVQRAFPATLASLGSAVSASLLPDSPGALSVAFTTFSDHGEPDTAWIIQQRWLKAEWIDRSDGLAKIEERFRLQDDPGLQAACSNWFARHSIWEFDDARGRAQVARILDLWPPEGGTWPQDPRAQMIRYFLAHREGAVAGALLSRSVSLLTNVPSPVAATCRLLGGDLYGSERIMSASVSSGSFEWTDFILRLVHARLAAHQAEAARRVFDLLPPGAVRSCDALLAQRELLTAEGRSMTDVDKGLDAVTPVLYEAADWSADGRLSICLDPEAGLMNRVRLTFPADSRAIVGIGWNDGRIETRRLVGGDSLTLPLAGLKGRVVLGVKHLGGSAVVVPVETVRE